MRAQKFKSKNNMEMTGKLYAPVALPLDTETLIPIRKIDMWT
jgi:hypothetical protein